MLSMMNICREKTMQHKHTGMDISQHESQEFVNCIQKYTRAPEHVMAALQDQMGQMWKQKIKSCWLNMIQLKLLD